MAHKGETMAAYPSIAFSITLVTAALTAGPRPAAQDDVSASAFQPFAAAVGEYMQIRRDVTRGLPALEVTANARQIYDAVEARAAALRSARAHAATGDIFTPEVRDLFRGEIRRALHARGGVAAHVLQEMFEEGEPWEPPAVNGGFSWKTAVVTPGCVLAVLPPLPEELQYRFVGPDLVLVDAEASLILDVMPGALESAPGDPGPET